MRNSIEIDYSHRRAILQEIGERLRTSLKEDPELPASLRLQLDRLRQLEAQYAVVGTPPADAKLGRLREGRTAIARLSVPLTKQSSNYVHLIT
jgi:hypothetical protein